MYCTWNKRAVHVDLFFHNKKSQTGSTAHKQIRLLFRHTIHVFVWKESKGFYTNMVNFRNGLNPLKTCKKNATIVCVLPQ